MGIESWNKHEESEMHLSKEEMHLSEQQEETNSLLHQLRIEQNALAESILPLQKHVDGHAADFAPDGTFLGSYEEFESEEYVFSV